MKIIYLFGAVITVLSVIICLYLFFSHKSKDGLGRRIELDSQTKEKPWSLGLWIAGVFVAGTGVALMYAPGDLVGYINQGLNPVESITMLVLMNGAPVFALYSVLGLWYMKYMDSKIGKYAAILSTILGMAISCWTGTNTITKFIGYEIPGLKFIIAAVIIGIAMLSARFGWLKKMSVIAFLVFLVAFLALISTPNTDFNYVPVSGHITKAFWTEYFTGATSASWIFWFLSWAPTVARWLAHISKGRTMKEYIAGTMLIPTLISVIWMTVSWTHQDIIMGFNLANNLSALIPCVIFIISGMLFLIGTLDSDCRVFTEDVESLSKGVLQRNKVIPAYGLSVLFLFCLFTSGTIKDPFAFNEYSSFIFIPLILWGMYECLKLKNNRDLSRNR